MRAGLIVIACAITGGGSCKDKPAAKHDDPRAAAIAAGSARTGLQVRKPNWTRPGSGSATAGSGALVPKAIITKLSVEEATPIIPTVPDTEMIDPPTAAPQGAQVHFAWCTT